VVIDDTTKHLVDLVCVQVLYDSRVCARDKIPLPDLSHASTAFRETSGLAEDRATRATKSSSPISNQEAETDVEISPELIDAFCASLRSLNVTLRFFTGSWTSLLENQTSVLHTMVRPYDMVLTSETIYRQASLESLIGVLSSAAAATSPTSAPSANKDKVVDGEREGPWCLVAAKVVYFGVGGGVSEFLRAIKDRGEAETVWDQKGGVGRVVMRVRWNNP
jgi:protein-histidine N-methyltransferase